MNKICVEITATRGSAPRDAGTVMCVTQNENHGTIGGGALEHRAIATARQMLREGTQSREETLPLGPGLGQCCGGSVALRFSRALKTPDADLPLRLDPGLLPDAPLGPLWLWGAGHVGRAVVRAFAGTKAFEITWIDTAPDRFPAQRPFDLSVLPTADMPRLAAHAPPDAHHLIFTYSHDIDLALCAALLRRGFRSCGVIGSATKWARFKRRLQTSGLNPAAITCPIGDPAAGKHPDQIAHSTARALLRSAQFSHDSAQTQSVAS